MDSLRTITRVAMPTLLPPVATPAPAAAPTDTYTSAPAAPAAVRPGRPPSIEQIVGEAVQSLAPLLSRVVPEKVGREAAGLLSGAAQQLGSPAPEVKPEQGSAFVAQALAQLLGGRTAERMAAATSMQKMKLLGTGQALLEAARAAGPEGVHGWLEHSPAQLDAFLDAFLPLGVPTADEINERLRTQSPPSSIAAAVTTASGASAVGGNRVSLYVNGTEAYPVIEKMLGDAQHSIHLETYTWHDDGTGRLIADIVERRDQAGVDAQVIYDSVGQNSYYLDRPKANLADMAAHGVEVRQFNSTVLSEAGINLTHRKLFLVDGEKAMTGGMNIGDNYSQTWQDSMVGIEGPVVGAMEREFMHDWQIAGGQPAPVATPKQAGDMAVQVLVSSPRQPDRNGELLAGELAAIDAAKSSIWLENPYFTEPTIGAHLEAAAKRGVSVNLLLPRGNDMPLFSTLNAITAAPIVKAGAHLWLVDTGDKNLHFNHTKLMVVDGEWTLAGSANADPRSFNQNQELSLGITDGALAADVQKRVFDRHLQTATPVSELETPANARLLKLVALLL